MPALPRYMLDAALNLHDRQKDDVLGADLEQQAAPVRAKAFQAFSMPTLDDLLGSVGLGQQDQPEQPAAAQPVPEPRRFQLPDLASLLPQTQPKPAAVAAQDTTPTTAPTTIPAPELSPQGTPVQSPGEMSAPATTPSTTSAAPSTAPGDGSWGDKAYAAAVKAGHPNPREFVEQMRWESGNFSPDVISGKRDSSAGARGIAQIMPGTAAGWGVNPLDPDAALAAAARAMTGYYQKYGDSRLALGAYNAGEGNVNKYGLGVLDADFARGQTRDYVNIIHQRTGQGAPAPTAGAPITPAGSPLAAPAAAPSTAAGASQITVRNKRTGATYPMSQSSWDDMTNKDQFEVVGPIAKSQPDSLRASLNAPAGGPVSMKAEAEPMPEAASTEQRWHPWADPNSMVEPQAPAPVRNIVPYDPSTGQAGEPDSTPVEPLQYRQPLGDQTTANDLPSSYNDPTNGGTISQPLPSYTVSGGGPGSGAGSTPSGEDASAPDAFAPPAPAALPSSASDDPGGMGQLGQDAVSTPPAPVSPYDNGPPDATHRVAPDTSPTAPSSPLKPVWDAQGNAIGYVHEDPRGRANAQQSADVGPVQSQAGEPDYVPRPRGVVPAVVSGVTSPEALGAASEAVQRSYNDPLTATMPAPARAVKIISDTAQAYGDAAARRIAQELGVSDEALVTILGHPISGQDIAGFAGGMIADPTSYIAGPEPVAHFAGEGIKRVVRPALRAGADALGEAARGVGTRIGEGLAQNAERVAGADARMAAEGSTAANATLGAVPEAARATPPMEPAPTFYSQLRRVIEDKMPNRAAPQQVQSIARGGAKPDEITWTGLDDFLREQKGPVTKQQVLDYLDQNAVKVEEVVKGAPVDVVKAKQELEDFRARMSEKYPSGQPGTAGKAWKDILTPDEMAEGKRLQDAANAPEGAPTKYGNYTLPGGKNYRELLLTRPVKVDNVKGMEAWLAERGISDSDYGAMHPMKRRALMDEYDRGLVQAGQAPYQSAHWDEPNVLAHVRFNERVGPDGKRVLNIEEIQSDWHQAGRKEGYQGTPGRSVAEIQDALNSAYRAGDQEAIARLNAEAIGNERSAKLVPQAPFQKTWPELAMKRMIRWAAENGFDRIAWPPGQVHADRYSLAQHVDELFYTTKDGAVGTLIGQKGGHEVVVHDNVPANKLGDYVGQDVADRMMSMEPDITAQGDQYYITGRNLAEMGGEGMKGFYDQILPSVAQKLGKKFGARVGTSILDVADSARNASGDTLRGLARTEADEGDIGAAYLLRHVATGGEVRSPQDALEAMRGDNLSRYGVTPRSFEVAQQRLDEAFKGRAQAVHSMDITPQMKQSVMEQGQPLFATAGTTPSSAPTDRLGAVNRVLGQGLASATSGGVSAAAADQLGDPNDPNRQAKAFVAGATVPFLASRGGAALASRFGRGAEDASGALATLGPHIPGSPTTPPMRQGGLWAPQPPGAVGQFPVPAVQRAVQHAQRQQQPGLSPLQWLRKFAGEVGYSSMIGPATATVNLTGDLLEPLYAIPKEAARAASRGNMREFGEMAGGAFHGLTQAGGAMVDALMARGKYVAVPGHEPLSQLTNNPIGKAITTGLEVGGRVFSGIPDAFFGTIAQGAGEARAAAQAATDAGLKGTAWKQHVNNLLTDVAQVKAGQLPSMPNTQDIIDAGTAYAKRQTFQDPLGTVGKNVRDFATMAMVPDGKGGRKPIPVLGNLVTPFFNTPWNMNTRLAERTPIGFAMNSQASKFDKYYDATVGSALLAGLIAGPAASGLITGSGPSDPQKAAEMRSQGWRPYSVLIDGVYIPSRSVGVYGPLLNAVGDAHDAMAYAKDKSPGSVAADFAGRVGKQIQQQPYLQGLANLLSATSTGIQGGLAAGAGQYAASTTTRMVPYGATARTIGTMQDPLERTTDRGKNVSAATTFQQQVQLGLGRREGLPPAQDVLGRPQENPQQGLGALFSKTSRAKQDPIIQAYLDNNTDISSPRQDLNIQLASGTVTIPLAPDERREWNRVRGEAVVKQLEAIVRSEQWKTANPEARQKYLQEKLQAADDYATNQIRVKIGTGELRRRVDDARAQKAS